MHIDLESFTNDNESLNVVQVYLSSGETEVLGDIVDIRVAEEKALSIADAMKARFGKAYVHKYLTLHYQNMQYVYDLDNDGQKTIKTTLLKEDLQDHGAWYFQGLHEETIPSHLFPCTQSLEEESTIDAEHYRVNNRMYVVHEKVAWKGCPGDTYHSFYVKYNHSQNVELSKMQHDINRAIRMLGDCCRFA